MDEETFLNNLEDNGKRVFTVLKEIASSDGFSLEPTDRGYHLCLLHDGEMIRLIQIWPSPKNWLESRMQYIEEKVALAEDDRRKIRQLLSQIGFKPTTGEEGNMRWVFVPKRGMKLEESELLRLGKNIRSMAIIVKGSRAIGI